jgi:UDP-glucose 4-epimerase
MDYQTALVTGGAGFIGSRLSRALLLQGLNVLVVDDLSTGKRENVPEGARFYNGDIRDGGLMRQLLREHRVDILFHEAARVSIRDSLKELARDAENNIMGTVNLLAACLQRPVKKIIFASSMAVYDDSPRPEPIREDYRCLPLSPYGLSKLTGEHYCRLASREMGIPCAILRYFNTYGSGQQYSPYVGVITIFINRLLKGQAIQIFGDGEQRRDFIHVDDVVAANLLAMAKEDGINTYNIGTGKATSVNRLAEVIAKALKSGAKFQHLPSQRVEVTNSIADICKARDKLGFVPLRSLDDSLDDIIACINGGIHPFIE